MLDYFGNGAMILHHLLVMAAALGGGSCFDELAHQYVDLQGLSLMPIGLEELPILLQEGYVSYILL